MSYGQTTVNRVGRSIRVSADGAPIAKTGGITILWSAIAPASVDSTVYPLGQPSDVNFYLGAAVQDYVATGERFIRFGTVMCKIVGGTFDGYYVPYGTTSGLGGGTLSTKRGDMYILDESNRESEMNDHGAIVGGQLFRKRIVMAGSTNGVQTITVNATGGTFTVSYKGQTTAAQAFNVSAASLQTALNGLSTIGANGATVALNGSVYTVTFSNALQQIGDAALLATDPSLLTGGTQKADVALAGGTLNGPTVAEFEAAFPAVIYVD